MYDWASPPADSVRRAMAERGLPAKVLMAVLDLDAAAWAEFAAGRLRIDRELAAGLAAEIGGTVDFWLARDAGYVRDLAAGRTPVAAERDM